MAGRKLSHDQRRVHLAEVARLYLAGKYQHEIAEACGVTRQQIGYDLNVIRRMWQASAIKDFDARKDLELAKIDQLERTYWDAWERSCENATVDTTKAKKDERNGQTVEKATRVEGQVGDPSYLQGVERCIKMRVQILGLAAPIKNELTGRDGAPISGVGVDDVVKALTMMNDTGAARADSGDPEMR